MRSFAVLAVFVATACASAGTPLTPTEHARPALSLTVDSSELTAERSFPEQKARPSLPTADRARLSGRLTAGVRLCVAPDGSVQSLDVERPSGSAEFDRALSTDITAWEYEPYAAPDGLKVCERYTIEYIAD